MSQQTFWQRRWKLIVNLITLVALGVLIYAVRHQIVDTFQNIKNIHIWILLFMIPLEAWNYHAQTRLYQGLFKIVGNKLSYKSMYKASLELNFVNHVFPSGGVTGISYFALRMRGAKNITGSKATLVQIMKLLLTFLSFEVLLLVGVLALSINGNVSNFTMMVVASLSTALLFGTVGFAYMIGSKHRIKSFFTALTKGINWLIHLVRRNNRETFRIESVHKAFDDFHENYAIIRKNYKQLRGPFWQALAMNLSEILVVYVVYLAFGERVNIGAIILAYAVANFAGMISVLPGGVGIYEALMVAVLVSAGIPAGVSLSVTVTYRILNTLIQVPPGYYLYQKHLRSSVKSAGPPSAA